MKTVTPIDRSSKPAIAKAGHSNNKNKIIFFTLPLKLRNLTDFFNEFNVFWCHYLDESRG